MFVTRGYGGYNRAGEQSAGGLFLLLFSHPDFMDGNREIRAIVRYARLTQWGHWMMGSVRVGPVRIVLSGDYGADGLTNDCPAGLWERLHPLPRELAGQYWGDSTGHNCAGQSGRAIRAWAVANLETLRVLRPDPAAPPPPPPGEELHGDLPRAGLCRPGRIRPGPALLHPDPCPGG